ncbi:MAG TPA: redoxin domain-containing protein [Spirochaetia bacterium]|nr:redoxin domain-containing protein [Spirochaetia bacterium]
MARAGTEILDVGDMFPDLKLKLIDGSEIQTKTGLKHSWNAVLVYRGAWCPFCISQLKSFQIGLEKLEAEGIGVLAISTEPLEKARETQKATGATFPIAYGVPVVETAEVIGAFYDPSSTHGVPFLQSTGFLLGPDGRVMVSAYSSGALGRLAWQDVLTIVQYAKAAKKN